MITRGFSDSGRGLGATPLGFGRRLGTISRSGINARDATGRREGNGVREGITKSGRCVGGADGSSTSGLRVGLALGDGRDVVSSSFSQIGRIAAQSSPIGQQSLSGIEGRGVRVTSHTGINCPQRRSSGQHAPLGRGGIVAWHIGRSPPQRVVSSPQHAPLGSGERVGHAGKNAPHIFISGQHASDGIPVAEGIVQGGMFESQVIPGGQQGGSIRFVGSAELSAGGQRGMSEVQLIPSAQHGGLNIFVGAAVKEAEGQIRRVVVQVSFIGSQQISDISWLGATEGQIGNRPSHTPLVGSQHPPGGA